MEPQEQRCKESKKDMLRQYLIKSTGELTTNNSEVQVRIRNGLQSRASKLTGVYGTRSRAWKYKAIDGAGQHPRQPAGNVE